MAEANDTGAASAKLKFAGYLLLLIGVIIIGVAVFGMGTSVETGLVSEYAPSRVENLGLIAQRDLTAQIGGVITLAAVIMIAAGHVGGILERKEGP